MSPQDVDGKQFPAPSSRAWLEWHTEPRKPFTRHMLSAFQYRWIHVNPNKHTQTHIELIFLTDGSKSAFIIRLQFSPKLEVA